MGSVKKRPDGMWRARYRDDAKHEHARHFRRKIDAERWLSTVEADMLRGTYVDPRAGRMSFREYAEQWRVGQVHRPTTQAQLETHLRRHAYPYFGDRPINSVRSSELQAWVRRLSVLVDGKAMLAPATVEVVYRYVSAIFKAAVSDRLIVASPCGGIRLPKIEPKRIKPISTETVTQLRAAMVARCRELVMLGAGTGVRQGEAFAVELDHIDWLRRSLRVCQQLVLMPGEAPKIAPLKTASSYRTIPLGATIVDALAAHLAAFPVSPVEIEDTTGGGNVVRRSAHLLFVDDRGEPFRRTSFSRLVWQPARESAGVAATVTFHDLRHYYASLLIRHNQSVKVVQARLGHASAAETLDTYSHLWPDDEDQTRQAVDAVLGEIGTADQLRTEEGTGR